MTKRSADSFFDGYASGFDAIYGEENQTPFQKVLNRLFRRSMRTRFIKSMEACTPMEGKSVVDIGCGSGQYSIPLARRGAARVVGVDFAPGMLELARKYAESASVADRCEFVEADFWKFEAAQPFDYAVIMGVMDYIDKPAEFVKRVAGMTTGAACFSFPVDGGLLAAQRKLRYKSRCPLYMYTEPGLRELLDSVVPGQYELQRISRDFFVTVRPSGGE